MGFKQTVTRISDGTPVDAATTNPCLDDLQNNILYLKSVLDALGGGEALVKTNLAFDPSVSTGYACRWNGVSSRYESALADGTSRGDVAGVCLQKTASTAGDLLVVGWMALDFTPALQTGETTVIASRYYLSNSEPGKLTQYKPSDRAVAVLLADGQGHVIVLPQVISRGYQGYRGYQGPRGYQGVRGYQGWRGFQGLIGLTGSVTSTAYNLSGPAADSWTDVLDPTGYANGLTFYGAFHNEGTNSLDVRVTAYDMTDAAAVLGATLAPGDKLRVSHLSNFTGFGEPPWKRTTFSVRETNAGMATSYRLRTGVTG